MGCGSSSITSQVVTDRVFFDIQIGKEKAGRIVISLFGEAVPKTAANFRELCVGGKTGLGGKALAFKGSIFHRVIPGFMCQGGDFTHGTGIGGESIYGKRFEDENFKLDHAVPFLLSMANSGRDSNGSQFFITVAPTPFLDFKHVVFGHVADAESQSVVKAIEAVGSESGTTSKVVTIADCGVI